MRKIAGIIFFTIILTSTGITQSPQADSIQAALTHETNPFKRFDLIRTSLELVNISRADNVDSVSCIELLKIANQLKNDSLLATSYNWLGSYFSFTKGDMASALEYYFKGIPLAEKANDKRRISSLYFDITVAYNSLHNYSAAFENNNKGGNNLPATSSPLYYFMLAQYQRNACYYYLAMEQQDSALHYAQRLSESAEKLGTPNFSFSSLFLNAAIYALKNDTEMANLFFKRANALSGTIQLNTLRTQFYGYYLPFLFQTKQIPQARATCIEFMDLANQYNSNTMQLQAAGFMRRLYDSLGRTDSAYQFSRMEAAANARIYSQENLNRIQSLAFNEQIRSIEAAALAATLAEERQQNIQFALIALGIIVLLTLFPLLSRSFITSTRLIEFFGVIALLIVFEFLNLLLHPFLERITHHSPVLMLLGLVIIAALLVPLHHKMEKWAIRKLVEKNKRIRLAAAKKTIAKLEGDTPNR